MPNIRGCPATKQLRRLRRNRVVSWGTPIAALAALAGVLAWRYHTANERFATRDAD
jgi:hypothetical protein